MDGEPGAWRDRIRGHIDGVGPSGCFEGWVADLLPPHRPVKLRISDGARLLAEVVADRPRPDVKAAGFGNGFAGFSVALPPDLFDGAPRSIRVIATNADEDGAASWVGSFDESLTPQSQPAHITAEPRASQTAEAMQAAFAREALGTALARIEELERSQRATAIERDALQARLHALAERFGQDLAALAGSPLARGAETYLGAIVRSMSLPRRRALWLEELSRRGLDGHILGTMPHDGAPGPLAVLVCGSGGIGDLLYLGTVVRELFLRFGDCQIFVANECPSVHAVFAGNPYVAGTIFLAGDELAAFIHALHMFDVFDLVAEVRYCVTYTTPPLSRAPRDFVDTASYRAAEWQRYVRHRWPHLNNLLASEAVARGLSKLGLVGVTATLPIDAASEIDFFPSPATGARWPALRGVAFATIHHGSDSRMSSQGGVQTKNLPTATWREIAAHLSAAGLKLVQLGEAHETPVDGVDLDLRGQTSLDEAALLLKSASVHLDTEGGLVHLARAMHTPSVVAFGPTPLGFFGYPGNANIAAPRCGNCWWTTDRWATDCPRELPQPDCMAAHSAAEIAGRALDLIEPERQWAVANLRAVAGGDVAAALGARFAELSGPARCGAVLLAPGADLQMLAGLDRPRGDTFWFAPADQFARACAVLGHSRLVRPFAPAHVPRNSASLDWAMAIGGDDGAETLLPALLELARCVRPGGPIVLAVRADAARLRRDVVTAQARAIGRKRWIGWPQGHLPDGDWLLIDLAQSPAAVAGGAPARARAEVP
jgi:ADP-heptose:LPS heptosyltransferase